jgi:hypothetical protein
LLSRLLAGDRCKSMRKIKSRKRIKSKIRIRIKTPMPGRARYAPRPTAAVRDC